MSNSAQPAGNTYANRTQSPHEELWSIMQEVPKLNNTTPYVVAAVNVVLPGVGTMIAACVGYPQSWSKTQLSCGLLQMLTAVFVIGWLWSLYWSFLFIRRALKDANDVHDFAERSNRLQNK
jgi:hypothetical protein